MKTSRFIALMCAFFFAAMMSILAQGSLAPPPGPRAGDEDIATNRAAYRFAGDACAARRGYDQREASTIQDCIANGNQGDGIKVLGDSLVRSNQCTNNGLAENGAGINAVSGGRSRIENNNAVDNHFGIEAISAGNVIVRNTAGHNTTNYSIAAGNHYGPIIDDTDETPANAPAATGNSAAGDFNTINPWANIAY